MSGHESPPLASADAVWRLAVIAEGHDCEVDSIDYTDTYDPDLRVERLVSFLKGSRLHAAFD